MPTNSEARKARERRLRAKYRKKTAVTAIITLLIGLIAGFVLCAVSVSKPSPISRMLKVGPLSSSMTPTIVSADQDEDADLLADEDADFGADEDADFAADEDADFGADEDADFAADEDVDFGADEDADFGADEDADFGADEEAFDAGEDADFGADEDAGLTEVLNVDAAPIDGADVAPADGAEQEADADAAPIDGAEAGQAVEAANLANGGAVEAAQAASSPEPTAVATPEPTPMATTAPMIVPYGQAMMIQTEVNADGTKRTAASDQPFETLNFSLVVDAYKNPAYFQETYSTQYKLNGDEAAVQFDITLNGYTGALQIVPQDVLLITFMGRTPDITDEGYQLMDAEIAGKTDIAVTPNTATTLYKRYSYSAAVGDMKYMVVTTYNNGQPTVYWFDIEKPVPVETPVPEGMEDAEGDASDEEEGESTPSTAADGLTVGSEGEEVSRLQRALIAKGLLQGAPDGKFGNYTAEAVRIMQGRYGMEQTGVADQAFLSKLYADQ